jgi:hypothetical protein
MKEPIFNLTLTEFSSDHTTITVREQGISALIHFRGDGIWQWGLAVPAMSTAEYRARRTWLRSHGTRICWAEWLHDGLKGWHACVLYTGDTLAILPDHPDYEHVAELVRLSQLTDPEVIKQLAADIEDSNAVESFGRIKWTEQKFHGRWLRL